jgi:hypothetical protein
VNPNASFGQRALAAVSLASEVLPLSIGDVKDAAKGVSRIVDNAGDARSAQMIYRSGSSKESATRLHKKATEAAEGKVGIHGVSANTTRPDHACSGATCGQLEAAGFRVRDTPSNHDPNHKTIEMPNPVTPDDAKRFNTTMGRSK